MAAASLGDGISLTNFVAITYEFVRIGFPEYPFIMKEFIVLIRLVRRFLNVTIVQTHFIAVLPHCFGPAPPDGIRVGRIVSHQTCSGHCDFCGWKRD
jgi:hypothetical protein